MATSNDQLYLTTPHGHEVRAEVNYQDFVLKSAKVVHSHTGVIRPLDAPTRETLERALRARQVYEHALSESEMVEQTLKGFGGAVIALGSAHPALHPYWREATLHRQIAQDMSMQAQLFHEHAMTAIDAIAEK